MKRILLGLLLLSACAVASPSNNFTPLTIASDQTYTPPGNQDTTVLYVTDALPGVCFNPDGGPWPVLTLGAAHYGQILHVLRASDSVGCFFVGSFSGPLLSPNVTYTFVYTPAGWLVQR